MFKSRSSPSTNTVVQEPLSKQVIIHCKHLLWGLTIWLSTPPGHSKLGNSQVVPWNQRNATALSLQSFHHHRATRCQVGGLYGAREGGQRGNGATDHGRKKKWTHFLELKFPPSSDIIHSFIPSFLPSFIHACSFSVSSLLLFDPFELPSSCLFLFSSFILLSLLKSHCSSVIFCQSVFVRHGSSFISHSSSFICQQSSFIRHRSSFITQYCHRSSFISHQLSFLTH